MAETRAGVDSRDATRSPVNFSAGLAAAVFCQDPPQIFDMALPPVRPGVLSHRLHMMRPLPSSEGSMSWLGLYEIW